MRPYLKKKKKGWVHGSSGRAPTLHEQGTKFNPQRLCARIRAHTHNRLHVCATQNFLHILCGDKKNWRNFDQKDISVFKFQENKTTIQRRRTVVQLL
jgi:hypothetical protein